MLKRTTLSQIINPNANILASHSRFASSDVKPAATASG